jgi:hypothetical protein
MRLLRRLSCLPVVALLSASGFAQFDILDWSYVAPGPGWTSFNLTADSLTVSGPTYPDPCLSPIDAYAYTVIPFDATVSFRVDFTPDDSVAGFDWPIVVVSGDVTHLTETCQGCEVVVDVPAGGTFGIGNHSQDCLFTASVSIFTELKIVPRADSSSTLGVASFENYGHAVARLGDLDADGVDDLAIGAPRATVGGPFSGRVTVLSGADGTTLFVLGGDASGQFFGFAIAAAGDVNDDGVPDLLVGAPFAAGAGNVRLFSGAGGGLLGTWTGDAALDNFGAAVASVGDADGDGVPDFVVGAPKGDLGGPDTGYARVYSGATGAPLTTVTGTTTTDGCGAAVAAAGDLDGDGVPEFIVGTPNHDAPPLLDVGLAAVRSAQSGALLWSVEGDSDGGHLGASVASAGDVDGDLTPDVVLGAPQASTDLHLVGRADVYSGATGALLFSAEGGRSGDRLGAAVAGAGDVDADGAPDVLVGAPGAQWTDDLPPGTARVLSGRDGALIGVVEGGQSGASFGAAVSSAGDTDGDGHAEILVGAPAFNGLGTDSGKATLWSLEVIWANFGHALAGSMGTPTLTGSGLLAGGELVKLKLQNVPASVPAALVIGFDTLLAPFKGGVLVPDPSVILALHTGASGLNLSATWPNGLPSGFDAYFQFWISDPAGPAGFSASNGIRATTP